MRAVGLITKLSVEDTKGKEVAKAASEPVKAEPKKAVKKTKE